MQYEDVRQVDCVSDKIVTIVQTQEGLKSTYSAATKIDLLHVPMMVDLNIATLNNSFSKKAIQNIALQARSEGVEHMLLSPFGKPALNNESTLESVKSYAHIQEASSLHCSIEGIKDESSLSDISTLIEQGAKAISIYSDINSNLMRRIMQYAVMKKVPIFCTLKDRVLNAQSVMNEGRMSSRLGLVGNNSLAEVVQIGKVIEMARYFNVVVVIRGISTVVTLDRIAQAKKEGVSIYAEVALHHLVRDDSRCNNYNTYAKIFPPLRSNEAMLAMQMALKEGKIDLLSSMHAPKSAVYKEEAFALAKDGTEGLESLFALYYTLLVESGLISLQTLLHLVVQTPASLLGLQRGVLEERSASMLFSFTPNIITNVRSLYDKQTLSIKLERLFSHA